MLRCHGIGIEIQNDCPFIMPNACVPVYYGRGWSWGGGGTTINKDDLVELVECGSYQCMIDSLWNL